MRPCDEEDSQVFYAIQNEENSYEPQGIPAFQPSWHPWWIHAVTWLDIGLDDPKQQREWKDIKDADHDIQEQYSCEGLFFLFGKNGPGMFNNISQLRIW